MVLQGGMEEEAAEADEGDSLESGSDRGSCDLEGRGKRYQVANEEAGWEALHSAVDAARQGDPDGDEVGEGVCHFRDVRRELVVDLGTW